VNYEYHVIARLREAISQKNEEIASSLLRCTQDKARNDMWAKVNALREPRKAVIFVLDGLQVTLQMSLTTEMPG
jgi:hypothetical protein